MPYQNEHACRLRSPDDFEKDSFRRVNRTHEGKRYAVIMGKLKGEDSMTEQAYRYPKAGWTVAEARAHCTAHEGIEFAPASGDEEAGMTGVLETRGMEYRFVGSPRNPYGTHASKSYPGGRSAWLRAWTVYLSGVADQGPIQGTIRRVSMIAAGMKPKCDLPAMSAEDVGPRSGPCGKLEGKIYEKPADYGLDAWKKPGDDDLEAEDVQLTCQDLEDIKRVCLKEIAKRQACAEEKEEKGRLTGNPVGEIERRTVAAPELRVVEGAEGEGPRIEGYAAVFDELSEVLWGFRERIQRGAFAKTIEEADVRALWNHDVNMVLGRTANGTLRLREDERGLRYVIEPPDTSWARDALVSIGRGDVNQSSFGFEAVRDKWEQSEGEMAVRTLMEVRLYDVSPVTFPAYPQTTSEVRARAMELGDHVGSPLPAPGQEAHPGSVEAEAERQVRFELMRRRLELAELE